MRAGDRIGRFEIERVLGRGAMGVVYLALDPVIGRKVAVKTLRHDLDVDHLEEFKQRFLREARAVGRLSHPNIVTIFDVGQEQEDGGAFIAMEYIPGASLEELIATSAPLQAERAVALAATLAETLAYAHAEGVIHRDIKPANILLTPTGSPKITDFGLARLETSDLTVGGTLMGTPYYMSPEQVSGTQVDQRSDIFALGIVLHEMLTRRRPFVGASLLDILNAILSTPAPELTAVCPDLPDALCAVVHRTLEKDPDQRFQSGADLARALREIALPRSEVPAKPPRTRRQAPTRMARTLAARVPLQGSLHFVGSLRRVYVRSGTELIIGRDATCGLRLERPTVSRRHARVLLGESGALLEDLGSANGSTCNAAPLTEPVLLNDGDMLGIGPRIQLLVRIKGRTTQPRAVVLHYGEDEYVLARQEVLIGSNPLQVDVRIDEQGVAQTHVRLCSASGSMVSCTSVDAPLGYNGKQVTDVALEHDATLRLGRARMVWKSNE